MKPLKKLFLYFAFFSAVLGGFTCANQKEPKNVKAKLEQSLGAGSVTELPNTGLAYVINDFHGDWKNYQRFLKQTKIFERMENGEDIYLVINGDMVDKKDFSDKTPGDSIILEDIKKMKAKFGERVGYNRGNHEDENIKIENFIEDYMAKNKISRDSTIVLLYNSKDGDYFKQFNFIERTTPGLDSLLNKTSLVTYCANGTYIIHGLYPEGKDPITALLWGREGDGKKFLKENGGTLIVNGHSYPSRTNELGGYYDGLREIGVVGEHRIITAPSEGSDGTGTFVVLDLSKTYKTQADLKRGKEIIELK
jgi:hypothetical protein